MTITLRVFLIVFSIATAFWVLRRIRKSQVMIEDSVFWLLFSVVLVLMGIFPDLVSWGAGILGVYSPVNFTFLTIIFILIVKLFRMNIRVSQLESKLHTLVQRYAIDHKDSKKKQELLSEKEHP